MYHWKYVQKDVRRHEHLLVMTQEHNEELMSGHYEDSPEVKSHILARTFLCAYWILPVYENDADDAADDREPIGTEVRYCFSGDIGGSIPSFIQNTVGPKTAVDSVKGLMNHVRKQAALGTN